MLERLAILWAMAAEQVAHARLLACSCTCLAGLSACCFTPWRSCVASTATTVGAAAPGLRHAAHEVAVRATAPQAARATGAAQACLPGGAAVAAARLPAASLVLSQTPGQRSTAWTLTTCWWHAWRSGGIESVCSSRCTACHALGWAKSMQPLPNVPTYLTKESFLAEPRCHPRVLQLLKMSASKVGSTTKYVPLFGNTKWDQLLGGLIRAFFMDLSQW